MRTARIIQPKKVGPPHLWCKKTVGFGFTVSMSSIFTVLCVHTDETFLFGIILLHFDRTVASRLSAGLTQILLVYWLGGLSCLSSIGWVDTVAAHLSAGLTLLPLV